VRKSSSDEIKFAGIDEAGRGPWAGPVVAAAVMGLEADLPPGITDSKKLSPARREVLYEQLMANPRLSIGVGMGSVAEIDEINILQATMMAMARALSSLPTLPAQALVDGNRLPPLPCPTEAIIKGDLLVPLIGAASIIAKVSRDRLMNIYSQIYPGYGFETNQGYGTKLHSDSLKSQGICPLHRRSFKPIHKILCEQKVIIA